MFHAILLPVFIEFSRCIDAYSSAKFELIIIPEIEACMITNPDGVEIEYYCQVDHKRRIIPVILLDKLNNNNMFESIKMVILALDEKSNRYYISNNTEEISKMYRKVIGSDIYNTHHPDEIAADYFSLIVSENKVNCEKGKQIILSIKKILFNMTE